MCRIFNALESIAFDRNINRKLDDDSTFLKKELSLVELSSKQRILCNVTRNSITVVVLPLKSSGQYTFADILEAYYLGGTKKQLFHVTHSSITKYIRDEEEKKFVICPASKKKLLPVASFAHSNDLTMIKLLNQQTEASLITKGTMPLLNIAVIYLWCQNNKDYLAIDDRKFRLENIAFSQFFPSSTANYSVIAGNSRKVMQLLATRF